MRLVKQAKVAAVICLVLLCSTFCQAAEHQSAVQTTEGAKSDLALGLIAVAAALAVGLCALATAMAQSRIGAAGCGTLAEKPELLGRVLILVGLAEGIAIYGLIVAVLILNRI